jgi:hypothetical protein
LHRRHVLCPHVQWVLQVRLKCWRVSAWEENVKMRCKPELLPHRHSNSILSKMFSI